MAREILAQLDTFFSLGSPEWQVVIRIYAIAVALVCAVMFARLMLDLVATTIGRVRFNVRWPKPLRLRIRPRVRVDDELLRNVTPVNPETERRVLAAYAQVDGRHVRTFPRQVIH